MSSKKRIILKWITRSTILSTITAFIVLNLISVILTGGYSFVTVLANTLPTIFVFILSSIYNEDRKSTVDKKKKRSIIV